MSKALRDKLLLAISEVHSGNGTEGEQIADAVLSVIAHLAEDEEVVRRVKAANEAAFDAAYDGTQSVDFATVNDAMARAALRSLSGKE